MSNNLTPPLTPVAAPTAVPTNLPNIPPNAYQMLSNLADAIDTANAKFQNHASALSDIRHSTDAAVNDVTTNSKGQTTDTLANIWQDSQTDMNRAHDQLATITTHPGGLGAGNQSLGWMDFRMVLEDNRSAIQTGLIALENLQNQQSGRAAPVSPEQLNQWSQDIQALDTAIQNIDMVIESMAMAIRNLNNGFSYTCATGLVLGGAIPLFNQNAFAHQIHGGYGGGTNGGNGKISAQQLEDYILGKKGSKEAAAFIPMLAEDHGLSLDNIKALIDTGVKPERVLTLLKEDSNCNITDESLTKLTDNVTLLRNRGGGDATQSVNWLDSLNDDQLANLKNRAAQSPKMSADDLQQLVDPKLEYDPNPKHDVIRPGVSPQSANGQRALDNSVSYKSTSTARVGIDPQTEEIVVLDDTNNRKYHGHVETWDQLD